MSAIYVSRKSLDKLHDFGIRQTNVQCMYNFWQSEKKKEKNKAPKD